MLKMGDGGPPPEMDSAVAEIFRYELSEIESQKDA